MRMYFGIRTNHWAAMSRSNQCLEAYLLAINHKNMIHNNNYNIKNQKSFHNRNNGPQKNSLQVIRLQKDAMKVNFVIAKRTDLMTSFRFRVGGLFATKYNVKSKTLVWFPICQVNLWR